MDKVVRTLREALELSGLQSGMTVSFHHHLRNGDRLLNLAMNEIAAMGIRDLTVNASSLFDCHAPLAEHIRSGVVRKLQCDYMSSALGRQISEGLMAEPVEFRTHGGRASDMELGRTPVDVAILAAPTADTMGNCSGKFGPAACGSLGYAFADAYFAEKVIVVTDNLVPYPLTEFSLPETCADYVVAVDSIGDPRGIVSGTTKITRDPVGLIMAETAARVIEASGLLRDGFSFQTGAGGASLAAARCLRDIMLRREIQGSFALGGITGYMVDMLRAGCFRALMDVQCFDLAAVESIRSDPRHREVSAMQYAGPASPSACVDSLDAVILGATEIDTDFNVNVHTDSGGCIIGGSGGHSDTAAGSKLAMIIAPLVRARLPIVTEHVGCISTPGESIDVLVTQRGVAVNPRRPELRERLREAGLPVKDIRELKAVAEEISGVPEACPRSGRVCARVLARDGSLSDEIRCTR